MYPQVTQFETRQRLLLDELRLQEERRLARLPNTTPSNRTLAAASTAAVARAARRRVWPPRDNLAVLTRVVRALSSR
jgi:hypothetical protein